VIKADRTVNKAVKVRQSDPSTPSGADVKTKADRTVNKAVKVRQSDPSTPSGADVKTKAMTSASTSKSLKRNDQANSESPTLFNRPNIKRTTL
jgi:hypothetical protein